MARPSTYTQEIGDAICDRLAAGESLLEICRDEGMPAESTVRKWAMNDVQGYGAKYARARDIGLDHEADEIKAIADTCREGLKTERKEIGRVCSKCNLAVSWAGLGWVHGAKGFSMTPICEGATAETVYEEKVITADMIERAKLQIDARKWRLSKMAPKRYGDRLELAGDPEAPIQTKLVIEVVDVPKQES